MGFNRIMATAVAGGTLVGALLTATPAQAKPDSWCNSDATRTVCLYRGGAGFYGAANGPVGTRVDLIAPGGAVLSSATVWNQYAYTDQDPRGYMACIVGGPCATYVV
jgi:hypothetical protein